MNIATFLGHYQITENPFQAEEARHDAVFSRVEMACFHPDFNKILGDFERPSAAIVFGERGSGKTAIRLQLEDRLRLHNREQPTQRCLPLIYDELNPVLDRFSRHVLSSGRGKKATPLETIEQFKLVDHIDAMMNSIVPRLVDQVLGESRGGAEPVELDGTPTRRFRQIDSSGKHDLLTLQIHYDRPEGAPGRTKRLKSALRYRSTNSTRIYRWLAAVATLLTLAAIGYFLLAKPQQHTWLWYTVIILVMLLTATMAGRFVWTWWRTHRLAVELARKLRVLDRPAASMRGSLLNVDI